MKGAVDGPNWVVVKGGQIEPCDLAALVLVQCNTDSERVIVET
jgi:hypothetical protein